MEWKEMWEKTLTFRCGYDFIEVEDITEQEKINTLTDEEERVKLQRFWKTLCIG